MKDKKNKVSKHSKLGDQLLLLQAVDVVQQIFYTNPLH